MDAYGVDDSAPILDANGNQKLSQLERQNRILARAKES